MKSKYYIVDGKGNDVGEGPWEKLRGVGGAQEFLETEVGDRGARVVRIDERPIECGSEQWKERIVVAAAKSPSRRTVWERQAIAAELAAEESK